MLYRPCSKFALVGVSGWGPSPSRGYSKLLGESDQIGLASISDTGRPPLAGLRSVRIMGQAVGIGEVKPTTSVERVGTHSSVKLTYVGSESLEGWSMLKFRSEHDCLRGRVKLKKRCEGGLT